MFRFEYNLVNRLNRTYRFLFLPEYTRYSSDEAFNQIEHELHSFSTNSKYVGLIGDFKLRFFYV
jgi:hypothetical protein